MTEGPTILFAGGGSGGHLFPGIAVAEELLSRRDSGLSICFVGSERDLEEKILADKPFQRRLIPVEPLRTLEQNPWRFLRKNFQAWRAAGRIIDEMNPQVVVGLGSYIAAPVVLAASRRDIPVVLLEQNVVPGKANRFLSRWTDAVCLSFEESASWFSGRAKLLVTGNPLRRKTKSNAGSLLDSEKKTLLILGGSQGSHAVNELTVAAIGNLSEQLKDWRVIHQTGQHRKTQVEEAYRTLGVDAVVKEFITDLPSLYAGVEFVISRAGATTLAEIAAAGCPALLIPYPHAASNHQLANAKFYTTANAAEIIEESDDQKSVVQKLQRNIERLIGDSSLRNEMSANMKRAAKPDASSRVADSIESFLDFPSRKEKPREPHFLKSRAYNHLSAKQRPQ